MNFKRVRYSNELAEELMPLLEAHFAENKNEFYGQFNPDLVAYQQADAGGMLRIFTASHKGHIVGYQVFVIAEHLHSRDLITATQDILYIDAAHRNGLTGYRFIKWCQNQLKEDGIHVVHQVVPVIKNYGALFVRLGYEVQDVMYSKILQGAN